MMFYLNNLPVWGGKSDPDQNSNKFRLKTSILQLLGGFSEVHKLENIQKSIKDHYAIVDKNFYLMKNFEKELIKLESSLDYTSSYFLSSIQNLFLETTNNLQLSNDLITGVSQIILDSQSGLDTVESFYSDLNLSSNEISKLNLPINRKPRLTLSLDEHKNLKNSFNEFKINYKFNNLLIYLLTLELIIKIINEKIKSILESKTYSENYLNTLENILLVTIINYFKVINDFNRIVENKILILDVPKNYPNPFAINLNYHENCYCDHINQKTSTFTLLLSGYKIIHNLYSTTELKTFCGNYCSNSKSILNTVNHQKSKNPINTINFNTPKIYEIFITKDPNALKTVFSDLYLFLDDIKIYLITYSVITTYFRRASRTAICSLVADQLLFYIYQTYFYPIIKEGDKGIKNIKIKKSKAVKDYNKADIFNSLTKSKKDKLLKLIEVSKFKKESFTENSKLNKKDIELLISSVIFILDKILLRKGLKTFQDIKYKDFVEQVSFYFNPSHENINLNINTELNSSNENIKLNLKTELNKDLEISIFKIKLGERFVYAFEDANIIKNLWRNGMRSIDILSSTQISNEGTLSLAFNEGLIQENIDKLTNILPTNLPMLCQPNK